MTDVLIDGYFTALDEITARFPRDRVGRAIEILLEARAADRTVYAIGNGGSASTAQHFVCDLAKAAIVPGERRFKVIGLGDNPPLVSAWTNDSGFGSVFAEQLEPWLVPGDVLVAFSVHGGSGSGDAGPWSQNLVRAVALAKERGARTIGFSGFDGGALEQMCDVCLTVPSGDELLGTPLVESYHLVLQHLVTLAVRERIRAAVGTAT